VSIELDIDPLLILSERIRTKEATVGVVGLGYVGLPLLVAVGNAGFPVVGMEANPEKVDKLRDGRSYLGDVTGTQGGAAVRLAGRDRGHGRPEHRSPVATLKTRTATVWALPPRPSP